VFGAAPDTTLFAPGSQLSITQTAVAFDVIESEFTSPGTERFK
jgi:hypothetical protein